MSFISCPARGTRTSALPAAWTPQAAGPTEHQLGAPLTCFGSRYAGDRGCKAIDDQLIERLDLFG